MEDANIWNTRLTQCQVICLFDQITQLSNLKSLNIGENVLMSAPALKFAKAFENLTTIKIENAYLRNLQVQSLFEQLPKGKSLRHF